jgi:hypothetical protein
MPGITGVGTQAAPAAATNYTTGAATAPGSLGSLLTGAAGIYGAQNASEAQTSAINAGINTQTSTMGNINAIYNPQVSLGNSAMSALGSAEGLNGAAPNYSGFENMPGYQFAVQQGTQAIDRSAAASGSAYTPNTQAAVGQYVTGTAMQDYNTYIQQLMGSAGLGAAANQQLTGAQLETGTNISQLQQNSGQAAATGVSSAANAVGGAIGGLANSLTGGGNIANMFNGSGVSNSGNSTLNSPINYNSSTTSDQGIYNGVQSSNAGNIASGMAGLTDSDFSD